MRWYYFLIGFFVLSLMSFTLGCNVNNESIQGLYEDQNEEASKTATAFIDFAEAYEDALDSLNSLEPDDPNAEEVVDDISATLGSLADDMVASTANLISLEEQIQIALGNGNVQVQGVSIITGVGALAVLTVFGGLAYEAKIALEERSVCDNLPRNPGELEILYKVRRMTCIVEDWFAVLSAAPRAAVVTGGVAVAVQAAPHGVIKIAAETCEALHSIHNIQELLAVKQDGCSTQENHKIQNSVPFNIVADALQDDISTGDLYIAQSDGSDDGVFPFIPEGEWALLAFTPGHKSKFIPCVNVSADQTTDVTIVITPIDETDDGCGTTTTTITEDVCTVDWYVSYGSGADEENLDLSGDFQFPTMHITLPEVIQGPIVSIQVIDELNYRFHYHVVGDNLPSTIQYGDYSQPGTSPGVFAEVPAPALETDVLYQLSVDILNKPGFNIGFYINGEICE